MCLVGAPQAEATRWRELCIIYLGIIADGIASNILMPYSALLTAGPYDMPSETVGFYSGAPQPVEDALDR
jgi:hypothetical protein